MKTKLLLVSCIIFCVNSALFSQSFSVSPAIGKRGENLTVTFAGINTNFLNASQTQTQIAFLQGSSVTSSIKVLSATATSNTTMIADIFIQSSAVIGKYAVRIFNSIDGMMNLPDGFEVVINQVVAEIFGTKKNFKIYPNPASNVLNIQSDDAIEMVVISDLSGKTHLQQEPQNLSKEWFLNLNETKLSAQIYLITVKTTSGTQTQKLSIQ
jgi:hypothetical protein